jgi:hypothetical protein
MIQADQYYNILYYFLFILLAYNFVYVLLSPEKHYTNNELITRIVFILLVIPITIYIGLRPISSVFGDMRNYENYFSLLASDASVELFHGSDPLFVMYIKVCTKLMNVKLWFLTTAFITIGLQFWAIKRLFPDFLYLFFLASICSFTFYGSLVNGIRIGLATSIFLFGLTYYKKPVWMYVLFLISVGFHKSMILPVFASFVALVYGNTKVYISLWFLAIMLSLVAGDYFISLFSKLNFIDSRLDAYLLSPIKASKFSHIGFRYDFVLYSFAPIALGIFSITKNRLTEDVLYRFLLNIYIITNIFWVLVIESNYSNRFASLSWFLWPLIVVYPLLNNSSSKDRTLLIIIVILLEASLSFLIGR